MNQVTPFVISKFTNPSGEIVFRVSGWLDGKRVRKNFTTRVEAEAERQVLEVQRLQAESGVRSTITRLTEEQLQDAEAALRRLKENPGHSLLFCVHFTLANYRAPERDHTLIDAVTDYLTAKERERDEGAITACQVGSINKELNLLKKHFVGEMVSALTALRLTAYCERGKPSLKTVNNRRGILGTFFKFAFQKDWIAANPIERVPRYRLKRKRSSAPTITAAQAKALMEFVEGYECGRLVPFFALCLFAGIRPCVRNGEILKLRPEHVRLAEGVIIVPPEVSKVHEKRTVTIQPNLAAWLRGYPLEKFPIIPANLQHSRAQVAKKFALTSDVLRHTFISMFVTKFRSLGEAALQAGNSEAIIRKHYLDLKTTEEAEQFFGIMPKHAVIPAKPVATEPVTPAKPVLSVAA